MKTRSILLTAACLCAGAAPASTQTPTPAPSPSGGYVDAFRPTATSSLAERQTRTALRLGQRLTSGEAQLLQNFRGLYLEVWRNPDGLSPQQVCDALGTKAGNLFVIAGTMANALYGIDPAGIGPMVSVPPGYGVVIHADNTVTLTYTAPAPTPTPAAH